MRARRFCLDELRRVLELSEDNRALLLRMAVYDPDLHREARVLYQRRVGVDPPAFIPGASTGEQPSRDESQSAAAGDPMRVIYAPTAFVRPEGEGAINALYLALLSASWGLHENVQFGVQTLIPFGVVGFGATVKVGHRFDGGAVGFHGSALGVLSFAALGAFVAIGGPMLTLGDDDDYFNAGVLAYWFHDSTDTGSLIVPHVGGSVRAGEHVRLGIEVHAPVPGGWDFGELLFVLWGVRVFGAWLSADFALMHLVGLDRLFPVVVPFLNLGAAW